MTSSVYGAFAIKELQAGTCSDLWRRCCCLSHPSHVWVTAGQQSSFHYLRSLAIPRTSLWLGAQEHLHSHISDTVPVASQREALIQLFKASLLTCEGGCSIFSLQVECKVIAELYNSHMMNCG